MPTSFALRATTKSWRAANRAGAISYGASHSRVKSACKPTHSPTCNSPNHRRRPSRDGPPRSQHCVLSPSRQDTKARLRRDTNTPLRGCTNMGNHGAIIVNKCQLIVYIRVYAGRAKPRVRCTAVRGRASAQNTYMPIYAQLASAINLRFPRINCPLHPY